MERIASKNRITLKAESAEDRATLQSTPVTQLRQDYSIRPGEELALDYEPNRISVWIPDGHPGSYTSREERKR